MGTATGTFQYANGSPVANGLFQWKLSGDAISSVCVAPPIISGYLDSSGSMSANFAFNDALSTTAGASTFYQLTVKAPSGGQVWNENYYLTGTAANINTIPPAGTSIIVTTPVASGASFSSPGYGYFYGPGFTWPMFQSGSFGLGPINGTFTGGVGLVQFNLLGTYVITKLSIAGSGSGTSTSNVGLGIYDSTGATKLLSATFPVSSVSTLVFAATFAAVTLTPGVYLHVQSADTALHNVLNYGAFGNAAPDRLVQMLNTNGARIGWGANTSTAGALPTTLGSITAVVYTASAGLFPPLAMPLFEP